MWRQLWRPSRRQVSRIRLPTDQTHEDDRSPRVEEETGRNIEPLETSEEEEEEEEDEEGDFVLTAASQDDDVEWDIENQVEAELKRRWEVQKITRGTHTNSEN